jgi:hypothetical protein
MPVCLAAVTQLHQRARCLVVDDLRQDGRRISALISYTVGHSVQQCAADALLELVLAVSFEHGCAQVEAGREHAVQHISVALGNILQNL